MVLSRTPFYSNNLNYSNRVRICINTGSEISTSYPYLQSLPTWVEAFYGCCINRTRQGLMTRSQQSYPGVVHTDVVSSADYIRHGHRRATMQVLKICDMAIESVDKAEGLRTRAFEQVQVTFTNHASASILLVLVLLIHLFEDLQAASWQMQGRNGRTMELTSWQLIRPY